MTGLRLPPSAPDAERAVLGALLYDPQEAAGALERLTPESFYAEAHAQVFRAIRELSAQGKEANVLTVSEALRAKGIPHGYQDELMAISGEIVTAVGVEEAADILLGYQARRQAIALAGRVLELAYDPTTPTREVLGAMEAGAFALAEKRYGQGLEPMRLVLKRALQDIEAIASGGRAAGVPSGFPVLDKHTNGFRPGTLNIVAARPGMGKSAFALDIAEAAGVPVALFSLEMASEEMAERMITRHCGVDGTGLRSGAVLKARAGAVAEAVKRSAAAPIWIDDAPIKTPIQVLSQCRRLKAKEGLGLVIVDYLQFMSPDQKQDNRNQDVESISRMLKAAAKDLQVPIIALAQLSRECERREDKRPLLSDLRDSGSIEQDAHLVMFLYRDEVYNKTAAKGEAEIIIRKNRSGQTGIVKVTWVGEQTRFLPRDHHPEPPPQNRFDRGDWE